MRKVVEVTEVDGEGLEALLGEKILLMCANYFYAGKLAGVNDTFVMLEEASIVYETGAWNEPVYKDAQRLPGKAWYVERAFIESYGSGK